VLTTSCSEMMKDQFFFAFLEFNTRLCVPEQHFWLVAQRAISQCRYVSMCSSQTKQTQILYMKLHKALRDCFLIAVFSKAGWSMVIISETQKSSTLSELGHGRVTVNCTLKVYY